MDYYEEIKNKIIDNETYERVKDYSKERHRVITYYEIGKLLNEAGGKYGANIIKQYSKKLVIEVGTKYNERTLRRMRQLYLLFKKQKWSPLATKLSWSHYSEVLSIKDEDKLMYYITACISKNLSKMELREKIKSKEYERLPDETKNKIIKEEKLEVKDLVPNPILIKNKNNIEISKEHFEISNDKDEYLIKDRNSTLGTKLNDIEIGKEQNKYTHILKDGDIIKIGSSDSKYEFQFLVLSNN